MNGTKVWTTDAHRNHFSIALVRTDAPAKNRHAGSRNSSSICTAPACQVRPIRNIAGEQDFNEVVFTDCFVPDDRLVGAPATAGSR